jgi:hypothetical protein
LGKFIKGQSGNPSGSSRKVRARSVIASPDPSPDASPDPRTLHERVVAKLTSILDDQGVEVGHQLMAARLLEMIRVNDIKVDEHQVIISRRDAAIAEERAELAKVERKAAADLAAVEGLLADWPAMTRETAEEFVADLHAAVAERLPKGSLTEQLRRHLLGLPEPRLTAAEKEAVIGEMYGKYGLDYECSVGPEPEPDPPPKCGFKELPTPASGPAPSGALPADADREYLAQRAVQDERTRRQRIKDPAQVPPPPPPAPEPEPEPTEPPVMPAHLDSRIITFGDLSFYPEE